MQLDEEKRRRIQMARYSNNSGWNHSTSHSIASIDEPMCSTHLSPCSCFDPMMDLSSTICRCGISPLLSLPSIRLFLPHSFFSSTPFQFCWVVPYFCMNEVYRFFVIDSNGSKNCQSKVRWSLTDLPAYIWYSKPTEFIDRLSISRHFLPLSDPLVCVAFQYTVHRGELEGLWGKKGARER